MTCTRRLGRLPCQVTTDHNPDTPGGHVYVHGSHVTDHHTETTTEGQ